MKTVLRLLALIILGLLATACATSTPVAPTVEAPVDREQAAPPQEATTPQGADTQESAETVNTAGARPLFLDSYADW